jgi:nitrate reductase beta subunit
MNKVYNWQINRDMSYPYEGKYPERQFAAVFNINRCIACQTCTMACKSTWTFSKGQELMWWNNVETKPYGGYPQYWDVKLLNLMQKAHDRQEKSMTWNGDGEYNGMTIFEAAEKEKTKNGQSRVLGYLPKDHEWTKPNIGEDVSPPKTTKKDKMGYITDPIKLPEHKSFFFYLQRMCNHWTEPA